MSVEIKPVTAYPDNRQVFANGRSKFQKFRHVTRLSCLLASIRKRSKSADPRSKDLSNLEAHGHLQDGPWVSKNTTKITAVISSNRNNERYPGIATQNHIPGPEARASLMGHNSPLIPSSIQAPSAQTISRYRTRSQNRPLSFQSLSADTVHSHTCGPLQSTNPWSLLRRRTNKDYHNGPAKLNGHASSMSASFYDYPAGVKSLSPDFAPSCSIQPLLASSHTVIRSPYSDINGSSVSIRVKNFNQSTVPSRPVSDLLDNRRALRASEFMERQPGRPNTRPPMSSSQFILTGASIHLPHSFISSSSISTNQAAPTTKFDAIRAFRSVFGEPRHPKPKAVCKVTTCHRSPKLFPAMVEHDSCGESRRFARHATQHPMVYPPRQDPVHCALSVGCTVNCFTPAGHEPYALNNSGNNILKIQSVVASSEEPRETYSTIVRPTAGTTAASIAHAITSQLGVNTIGSAAVGCFASTTSTLSTVSSNRRPVRPQSTVGLRFNGGSKIAHESPQATAVPQSTRSGFVNHFLSQRPLEEPESFTRPHSTIFCRSVGLPSACGPQGVSKLHIAAKAFATTCEKPSMLAGISSSPLDGLVGTVTAANCSVVNPCGRERSRLVCPPVLRPPRPPLRTTSLIRDMGVVSSKYSAIGKFERKNDALLQSCPSSCSPGDTTDTLADSEVEQAVLQQDPTWWLHLLPYKPSNLPTNLADRLRQRSSLMLSRSSPNARFSNSSLPTGLPNLSSLHVNQTNPPLPHLMTQSLYEQRELAVEINVHNSPELPNRHWRNESVPRHSRNRPPTLRPSSLYTEKMSDHPMHLPSLTHLFSSTTIERDGAANGRDRVSRPSVLAIPSLPSQVEFTTPSPATLTQTFEVANCSIYLSLAETSTTPLPESSTRLMDTATDSPLLGQYCRLLIMRTTITTTPSQIHESFDAISHATSS